MLQKFRSLLKNEKGLTLIELLAVVVILGIIAAIAVPSIGGLIDNSKKDAHLANAKQLVSSGRLVLVNDVALVDGGKITLQKMIDKKYIENIDNPHEGEYNPTDSYVTVEDGKITGVKLITKIDNKGVYEGTTTKTEVAVADLTRDSVK